MVLNPIGLVYEILGRLVKSKRKEWNRLVKMISIKGLNQIGLVYEILGRLVKSKGNEKESSCR